MPSISMDISGLSQLTARLAAAINNGKKETTAELYQFGEEVMADSKEVVPVDTGALMNTGQVHPPEDNGDEVSISLGYGDESVGYAVIVHENLAPNVHWTRPGSGPKYLENPLKAKQDSLPPRLLDAFKRGILR